MLQEKLTKRQQTIFNFIRETIEGSGFGPTIREIADKMGYRSPNGVMCHLRALQKKGLINRTSNKSRSIVLTEEAAEEVNGLPLAGRVYADATMEVKEEQERFDMTSMWPKKGTYVLEVEGDSMVDAQIAAGDYVIVKRRHTASKGDMVVARTSDGNATLKYWHPEKKRVKLLPANKKMKATYEKDAKVIGVVIGVVRRVK